MSKSPNRRNKTTEYRPFHSDNHSADVSPEGSLELVPPRGELPRDFGRYRILKELGRGGMGIVYLAFDDRLDREVALKIPNLDDGASPELKQRFDREAKIVATLSHPNICPVYDVGEVHGTHYLTMAVVQGHPLHRYVNPKRRVSARMAASIIRKVALALAHAHERGIIHRDLKPSNIFWDPERGPVVMDFGLARRIHAGSTAPLTRQDALLGTPSYMSPEQLSGNQDKVGPPSDMFSLGVVLYELLLGRRRFQGTFPVIATQILTEDPPSLLAERADLDPEIDAICRQMMQRNPTDRFGSMKELAHALALYLRRTSPDPSPGMMRLQAQNIELGEPQADVETATWDPQWRTEAVPEVFNPASPLSVSTTRRRKPALSTKITIGCVGLLGLVVLGVLLRHMPSSPSMPSTSSNASSNLTLSEGGTQPVVLRLDQSVNREGLKLLVDGNLIPSERWNAVQLSEGQHDLAIERDGQIVHRQSFNVHSDDNPPLLVSWTEPPKEHSPDIAQVAAMDNSPALELPPTAFAEPEEQKPTTGPPSDAPSDKSKPTSPPDIPKPVPPLENVPQIKPTTGKLQFLATVEKSINGFASSKKHSSPRAALEEIVKLIDREQKEPQKVTSTSVELQMNGNKFQFEDLQAAHEAVTAFEQAIKENVPVEKILNELQADGKLIPPADLSTQMAGFDPAVIATAQAELYRHTQEAYQFLGERLKKKNLPPSQADINAMQEFYEKEVRENPKIPRNYPIPKLSVNMGGGFGGSGIPTQYFSQQLTASTPADKSAIAKSVAEKLDKGKLID